MPLLLSLPPPFLTVEESLTLLRVSSPHNNPQVTTEYTEVSSQQQPAASGNPQPTAEHTRISSKQQKASQNNQQPTAERTVISSQQQIAS
jgi:hypothetical protein